MVPGPATPTAGRSSISFLVSLTVIAVVQALDRTDGDGDLLASPEVSLLEQDMGDVPVRRLDDEPLDLADLAVAGVHPLAAPHADLSRRQHVAGDDPAGVGHHGLPDHLNPVVRPVVGLVRFVVLVAAAAGEEVGLLGRGERIELLEGAAEADLARARLHEAERDQAAQAAAVLGLDDQVGDLAGDRVDDHPGSARRTVRRCRRRRTRS